MKYTSDVNELLKYTANESQKDEIIQLSKLLCAWLDTKRIQFCIGTGGFNMYLGGFNKKWVGLKLY